MYPLEIGFFTQHNFLKVVYVNSLFRVIADKYSRLWMYHNLLNHSCIEGHLGDFQFAAITGKTAVNICGQVSV